MVKGMCEKKHSAFWQICHPDYRKQFTKLAKRPLRLALVKIAARYPDLTKDILYHSNSHLLYGLMQEHMSHEKNPPRAEMIGAALKIGVIEYDHDIYYRRRFDRLLKKLVELVNSGKWDFDSGEPDTWPYSHCWDEPRDLSPDTYSWEELMARRNGGVIFELQLGADSEHEEKNNATSS